MTSKHNRNKIRTEKDNTYKTDQKNARPDHTGEDSEINEDSKTSNAVQNIDWNQVIKKTTGDFDAASEE